MMDKAYYSDYLDEESKKLSYQEQLCNYYADVIHEKNMIERENDMKRTIIDLKNTNLSFNEIMNLKDYI